MSRPRTYLDWNATAPLRPEARAAMSTALDLVGNPSSVHAEGRAARRVIENARDAVAALAGTSPRNVTFTSGATEANVWLHRRSWRTIFYTRIEHASVIAPVEAVGREPLPDAPTTGATERIPIAATHDGTIDLVSLEQALTARAAALAAAPGQSLLTLQAANNETGVVQPLAEAAALARAHRVLVASDAVQAAGRLALDFDGSGLAYMTLSAHKLGGPKGVGALLARPEAPLPPMLIGGGQERRLRAGTENVAAIAGFGAAAAAARSEVGRLADVARLRDRLEAGVLALAPDTRIVGRDAPRLPNTSCIALSARRAETMVAALDLAGIAVSAGAACSSGKVARSHVLTAMGLGPEVEQHAIRVSLGPTTRDEDVDAFLKALHTITARAAEAA